MNECTAVGFGIGIFFGTLIGEIVLSLIIRARGLRLTQRTEQSRGEEQ